MGVVVAATSLWLHENFPYAPLRLCAPNKGSESSEKAQYMLSSTQGSVENGRKLLETGKNSHRAFSICSLWLKNANSQLKNNSLIANYCLCHLRTFDS